MAEKRKAPAKTKAGQSKSKTKTKPVAKRVATKATASKKTVTKSATKATTRSGAKKAAAVKKPVSAKKAAATRTKKPVAVKKPAAKAAAKKASAGTSARTKTTAKAGPKTSGTKASTVGKTSVRVARKSTAKKASRKQTAASRKAVLFAAAKKFQAQSALKKNPNVSGSTRASALKAAGAKQKHAAVRALTVNASSGSGGKKVANPASGGAGSSSSTGQKAAGGNKKAVSQRHGFKINESVVYPAHGVGKIVGIEEQEIAGMALELFVIHFEKEKLTLRVPTGKLESVGMRKLSEEALVARAMTVLKGRARVKRTMWSRRAQEYVAKINSGDIIQIAEVVRDLYRSESQPEQSYSERQLYEDALDRMAREVAAVDKLDERGAVQAIIEVLSKSARNRRALEESRDAASDASKAA